MDSYFRISIGETNSIQKNANSLYYEIVGKNNLWQLLSEYEGKLFGIKTATRKIGKGYYGICRSRI